MLRPLRAMGRVIRKGTGLDNNREDQGAAMEGTSRREFLRKAGMAAGAAAWTVPTMQVINMAAAGAQENGTSVVATTQAPPCQTLVLVRLKAAWTVDGYMWTTGVRANDCLTEGFDEERDPVTANLPIFIEGDATQAKVTHDLFPACRIVMASHKAGEGDQSDGCVPATIGGEGLYAQFDAVDSEISHVELIVECCADGEATTPL